jgi:hypothetical protein
VRRRSLLGRLLEGKAAVAYPRFESDLVECAARVLAAGGDSELVFIGRSPESIFDVLSGLLEATRWERRLRLVPLSLWDGRTQEQERALRAYLAANDLDPVTLLESERPRAICDLVASGATLGELVAVLDRWCWEERVNRRALRSKLRFVCIVEDTMGSSWCEEAGWPTSFDRTAIRHVSVPVRLWRYLADRQPKTARSFTPTRWGDADVAAPERTKERLEALRQARRILMLGRTSRPDLVAALVRARAMRERWFRSLVRELRRTPTVGERDVDR